jgi:hypothetical protein
VYIYWAADPGDVLTQSLGKNGSIFKWLHLIIFLFRRSSLFTLWYYDPTCNTKNYSVLFITCFFYCSLARHLYLLEICRQQLIHLLKWRENMRWVTERTVGLPDGSRTEHRNDQIRHWLRKITTAWPQWIKFYVRQRRDHVRSSAGFSVLHYTSTCISYLVELFWAYVYLLTRNHNGTHSAAPNICAEKFSL